MVRTVAGGRHFDVHSVEYSLGDYFNRAGPLADAYSDSHTECDAKSHSNPDAESGSHARADTCPDAFVRGGSAYGRSRFTNTNRVNLAG